MTKNCEKCGKPRHYPTACLECGQKEDTTWCHGDNCTSGPNYQIIPMPQEDQEEKECRTCNGHHYVCRESKTIPCKLHKLGKHDWIPCSCQSVPETNSKHEGAGDEWWVPGVCALLNATREGDIWYAYVYLCDFIRGSILLKAEDLPMDVSNWELIGRERGYWDFFESKVREETIDFIRAWWEGENDKPESLERLLHALKHDYEISKGSPHGEVEGLVKNEAAGTE